MEKEGKGRDVQRHEIQVREKKPPDIVREVSVVSMKHRAKVGEREEALQRWVGVRWPKTPLLAEERRGGGKAGRGKGPQILAMVTGMNVKDAKESEFKCAHVILFDL